MARAYSSQASGAEPEGRPQDQEGRVAVRCFPDSDAQFRAFVQELIADSWELSRSSEDLLEHARGKLAARYPLATIHPRHSLAELGTAGFPTWYVYRDGRAA